MAEGKYLYYLGKPFVRAKDTIYYGDPADPYIVELKIIDTRQVCGEDVANNVLVKLKSTADMFGNRYINKTEKVGLYNAMDIASIWLQRKLRETEKSV